jgi:hypothetical protein
MHTGADILHIYICIVLFNCSLMIHHNMLMFLLFHKLYIHFPSVIAFLSKRMTLAQVWMQRAQLC